MNEKDRKIIDKYRSERNNFVALGDKVKVMIDNLLKATGISPMAVEHRVKGENSLIGKLYKYGDYYKTFEDVHDILGLRVICFFADEVDIVGKAVEKTFNIDRVLSTDKRALIDATSFGYLSLHYICSLKNEDCPQEFIGKTFEIQIRTGLQHIWAAIEHDIAYKSKFDVPRDIKRGFSRVAGLLELADDEFMRVRDDMKAYIDNTHDKIVNNTATDVNIDMVSLNEYMLYNKEMRAFLQTLCEISDSELMDVDPEAYLEQLSFLHIHTLGELENLMEKSQDFALYLAKKSLAASGLDILSSNVALRFLCRAWLAEGGYSQEQAEKFILLTQNKVDRAKEQAAALFADYEAYKHTK